MNDSSAPQRLRLFQDFCRGFWSASTVVALSAIWALTCGLSQSATVAGLLCAGLGVAAAAVLPSGLGRITRLAIVLPTTVVVWLAVPILDSLLNTGVRWFDTNAFAAFLPAGLLLMLIGFAVAISLQNAATPHTARGAKHWFSDRLWVFGAAAGCAGMLLHTTASLPLVVLPAVAAVVLVAVEVALWKLTAASQAATLSRDTSSPSLQLSERLIAAVAAGMLLVFGTALCRSFFPLATDVLVASATIGLLLHQVFSSGLTSKIAGGPAAILISTAVVAALPFCSESFVSLHLWLNGSGSGWTTILGRSVFLGAIWAVALLPMRLPKFESGGGGRTMTLAVLLIAIAVGQLSHSVLHSLPLLLAVVCAAASAVVQRLRSVSECHSDSQTHAESDPPANAHVRGFAGRWSVVGGMTAVAILAFSAPTDLTDTTSVLFSGRATVAHRTGLSLDLIRQSDSRRLLASDSTDTGRLAIWRTVGDQVEIRRDGFPLSYASTNVQTSPQTVSDAMTAVLPLVLHPAPAQVTLLGDEAGVGLHTCTNFPLLQIDAVRSDVQSTALVSEQIWQHAADDPFADERVTLRHEPVSLAIRHCPPKSQDVIIADLGGANRPAGQLLFTAEFYHAIRNRLTDDGLLCQRLPRFDLGAKPVLQIVAAAKESFERVCIVRMDAGELALLAGGSNLVSTGLFDRLQKPQVQQQLARCGWDWSQLAALPVVDTADPVGLLEHVKLPPAIRSADGGLAFSMTSETLRTADKNSEIRTVFAPHQRRLADVLPREEGYQEFARRYAAVIQQNEILTAFPDEPWPYRKSLKTEMQRNPRPPLEVTTGNKISKVAHPLDEHRKSYCVTLGEAIQQARDGFVNPATLRALTNFTAEYEPLLSDFAHHELIRIHEFTGHPSPALELRHRMHAVYFTNADDLSVRTVADAMQQLIDDPELLPTVAARYDHLNSMLQELVRRWDARRGHEPRSARRTQQNVDDCIEVANRALELMEQWCDELNIPADDIRLRRKFVNRTLIAPLRDYQQQVVHHRMEYEVPVEPTLSDDELPILSGQNDVLTTN